MADPIRFDTSMRLPVADPTAIEWFAADDALERHAFPRRHGYPPRALCGERWTTLMGHHGSGTCVACLAALREQIRSASAAVAVAEAEDLAAGDHHLYPEPAR